MRVPFNDLTLPTGQIKEAYLAKVQGILDKGHFVLSEEVVEFEKQWAEYVGTKYAVGVSNGGDALYMALVAAGVGAGDEVITQGNAYNASVTAILRTGASVKFADIDEKTLEMDVSKVESLITEKTKAIMPVHLYGATADMTALMEISTKHKIPVVEDCAQAHGAKWNGQKAGSFGLASGFSFYPTKNLGAFGDAGAVTTDSEEVYEMVKKLRNLGQAMKNDHQVLGFNMRLDPLQAAVLSLKLPFLDELNHKRREAGEYYTQMITQAGLPITVQQFPEKAFAVYHLYIVRHAERAKVIEELKKAEVDSGVYYPLPVYKQPFFKSLEQHSSPAAERVCDEVFALPLYPGITKQQQEYVIESLKNILLA